MNARWLVVLALVACTDKKKEPAPPPAKPAPPTQCDTDPDFVHVDRDQLAALCIEAEVPSTFWRPVRGALKLGDGQRVPWLAIQLDERVKEDLAINDWIARARAALHQRITTFDTPPAPEGKRTGSHWYNLPCQDTEVFTAVITVVALDKKGDAHLFAIRGDKMIDQTLVKPEGDSAFRAAFELTQKLLGQSAKIATHQLGGASGQLSTVDYDAWLKAANARP